MEGCAPLIGLARSDGTPPVIVVWYGDHQFFGWPGLAQKWVNLLGNILDLESGIREVTYTLNDGKNTPLRLGPDSRRLERPVTLISSSIRRIWKKVKIRSSSPQCTGLGSR